MTIETHLFETAVEHAVVDALDWEESIHASANSIERNPLYNRKERTKIRRFAHNFVHDRNKRIQMFKEREKIVLYHSYGVLTEVDATRRLLPIELNHRTVADFAPAFMSAKDIIQSRSTMYRTIMDKYGKSVPFHLGLTLTYETAESFRAMYSKIVDNHYRTFAGTLSRDTELDAARELYELATQDFLKRKIDEFYNEETSYEKMTKPY